MSNEALRECMTALEADRSGRFTRPSGDPAEKHQRPPVVGEDYGWNPRQQAAAKKLSRLWRKSLRGLGGPGGYGGNSGGGGEISDDEAEESSKAFREYSEAMQWLGVRCSPRHVAAVRIAVVFQDASSSALPHLVREALSELADLWCLK